MLRTRWVTRATLALAGGARAPLLLALLSTGGLLAAGALGVGPGLGSAAARPPTREAQNAARALAEEGMAHYRRGEYDEAIVDFRAANDKVHSSLLVYNIAQAHRLNGDCAEAVQAYEAFLAEEPGFRRRKKVEAWIIEMRTCAAEHAQDQGGTGAGGTGGGGTGTGSGGTGSGTGGTGSGGTGGTGTGGSGTSSGSGSGTGSGAGSGTGTGGTGGSGGSGTGTGTGSGGSGSSGTGGEPDGPSGPAGANGPAGPTSATGPALDGDGHGPIAARGRSRAGTRRALRLTGAVTAGAGIALGGLAAWSGRQAADASDEVAAFVNAGGGVWSEHLADLEARGERADRRALLSAVGGAVLVGGGATLFLIGSRISAEPPPVTVAPAPAGAGTGATLVWTCDF